MSLLVNSNEICKHWTKNGNCIYLEKCRFLHDSINSLGSAIDIRQRKGYRNRIKLRNSGIYFLHFQIIKKAFIIS
jgi:hypothetical protein